MTIEGSCRIVTACPDKRNGTAHRATDNRAERAIRSLNNISKDPKFAARCAGGRPVHVPRAGVRQAIAPRPSYSPPGSAPQPRTGMSQLGHSCNFVPVLLLGDQCILVHDLVASFSRLHRNVRVAFPLSAGRVHAPSASVVLSRGFQA